MVIGMEVLGYKILDVTNRKELEEEVMSLIKVGWTIRGNIIVYEKRRLSKGLLVPTVHYVQNMIKESEIKENGE